MTNTDKTQTQIEQLSTAVSAIMEYLTTQGAAIPVPAPSAAFMAKGTKNITIAAREAVAEIAAQEAQELSLAARIEVLLREQTLSFKHVCTALGASAGDVAKEFQVLRSSAQIYNLGTEDQPRWTWVIGDKTTHEVLMAKIMELITDQPMTYASLVDATGAAKGRVSRAIVQLQREHILLNLGSERRARWFHVPPQVVAQLKFRASA